MQSRRRLRTRLIVSFALFGICLSALFALASINIRSRVENELVSSALQHDVDQAVENTHQHPDRPFGSQLISGWLWSDRTLYKAPLAWQSLPSGVYDMHNKGEDNGLPKHYKLAVRRKYGLIAFITYDVSRDDLGRRQLNLALIGAVLIFSLISLVLGFWLSRRVIKPVTELASRLRTARQSGKPEPLAPYFAEDEVGELAAALDDYAQRQASLIERDREFNADVSHELRTPLAVIATTTELLMDNPDLSDKVKTRLKRIERAVRQSTELTQALLLLSRAERTGPVDGETTDVAKIAAEVIDTNEQHIGHKPVNVRLVAEAPCEVEAPSSVVAVALGNLVGNACKYTMEGEVVVRVQDGRVLVEDTGPGIKAEDAEHLFERGVRGEGQMVKGAGLGLAIVKRLCELYGWRVSLSPRAERGAVATLDFQKQ
ncbi:MAG: HAMP domain-containing histidine kinase [Proteobacteria bacterium]|nr:HAMP domain-containing histidine kinase [Pseudomonadota bacterium]